MSVPTRFCFVHLVLNNNASCDVFTSIFLNTPQREEGGEKDPKGIILKKSRGGSLGITTISPSPKGGGGERDLWGSLRISHLQKGGEDGGGSLRTPTDFRSIAPPEGEGDPMGSPKMSPPPRGEGQGGSLGIPTDLLRGRNFSRFLWNVRFRQTPFEKIQRVPTFIFSGFRISFRDAIPERRAGGLPIPSPQGSHGGCRTNLRDGAGVGCDELKLCLLQYGSESIGLLLP